MQDVELGLTAPMIHGMLDGIMFQYKTGIQGYDYNEMPKKIS